jgi:hypothetical protein
MINLIAYLTFFTYKKKKVQGNTQALSGLPFRFQKFKALLLCLYSYKLCYGTCKLALEKEKWLSNILFFPKKDIHNFRTCLTYTP